MALNSAEKKSIISEHQRANTDTGSTEVQVALLSGRISTLTEHLKKFKKDVHSRRGLINMVSKRRKLLDYLKGKNKDSYIALVAKLGLRK